MEGFLDLSPPTSPENKQAFWIWHRQRGTGSQRFRCFGFAVVALWEPVAALHGCFRSLPVSLTRQHDASLARRSIQAPRSEAVDEAFVATNAFACFGLTLQCVELVLVDEDVRACP